MRVLPIERIPEVLWKPDLLRLPIHLSEAYIKHLEKLGLKHLSIDRTMKDVHGGKSVNETHDHFARRFAVSAGRVEFSTLGPNSHFDQLSDAFLSTFSVGHIALLDIPCGTGAMSGALVSTLIKLREDRVIPTLPLTITICAGDYSPEALNIFNILMSELAKAASAQGITLASERIEWDATRGDQTARLVDRWFDCSSDATEYFVVVSNFSGALHSQNAFADFKPCLEHVLSRLHDKLSTIVWIEPATNSAKSGILKWLPDFIAKRISWFSKHNQPDAKSILEAQYKLENPISSTEFPTNLAVHRFNRT